MSENGTVVFTRDVSETLRAILRESDFSRIGVITDSNCHQHCYPHVEENLPPHELLVLESGESMKNLETCKEIWQWMTDGLFDRSSVVVCLGGGVIGDMAGFAASVYKRGVPFVIVPTTLLAMVDASVGGKVGVNFRHLKNHLGSFQLPVATIIDPVFLTTLEEREIRSGLAEVIKHALIASDKEFNLIRNIRIGDVDWYPMVERSVAIKESIVLSDPTEKGPRKLLNFGHTIGHAIESYLMDQPGRSLLHGEAVAIGMICEAYISSTSGRISTEELNLINELVSSQFGKVSLDEKDIKEITILTRHDKKNLSGEIRMVLLEGIGKATYDHEIGEEMISEALRFYTDQT